MEKTVGHATVQSGEAFSHTTVQIGPAVDRTTMLSNHGVGRAIVQSNSVTHRATVQSNSEMQCATVQYNHAERPAVTQVASTKQKIAKFRIVCFFGSKEGFSLDLPFTVAVSGRDLRAAVARARGVRAEHLILEQLRGRRKSWFFRGKPVVIVEGDPGWADEKGERVTLEDLAMTEKHVICDDEAVRTAGHWRAVIWVSKD